MDTALTQPLPLKQAPRPSFWNLAKATLDTVVRTLETSARGEAYDRVLGVPDAERTDINPGLEGR